MKIPLTKHLKSVDPEDAELIRLTVNGNTEAFSPIVQKYQRQIYNLIYRKVRDPEISKDLCQVVFLKAWHGLSNFKGKSTFYNWLYQIAVNCSIDFFRREKTQIASVCDEELSQNTDNVLQMTQDHLSPCEILEKKELAHVINVEYSLKKSILAFVCLHIFWFHITSLTPRLPERVDKSRLVGCY